MLRSVLGPDIADMIMDMTYEMARCDRQIAEAKYHHAQLMFEFHVKFTYKDCILEAKYEFELFAGLSNNLFVGTPISVEVEMIVNSGSIIFASEFEVQYNESNLDYGTLANIQRSFEWEIKFLKKRNEEVCERLTRLMEATPMEARLKYCLFLDS